MIVNNSDSDEKIILVDENDKELGFEDKLTCHQDEGILHRAYTILVSNNRGEVLLQKRAKEKMLWPLFWEATCSSHQTANEKTQTQQIQGAEKRLSQEMGFSCFLRFIGKFQYHNLYQNIGAEKEVCWLLVGEWLGEVKPNSNEAADYKWIKIDDLKKELETKPADFAPWLEPALDIFLKMAKR